MIRKVILYVSILLVSIWTLLPFYDLVRGAIAPEAALSEIIPKRVTLKHFEVVLRDPNARRSLINSLIVASVTTAFALVLAWPCSYALSRWKRGEPLLFGIYVLRMFPPISLVVPWFIILWKLKLLGTYIGPILAHLGLNLPLAVWLLKGFIDTLPRDLEEAAFIDGANLMQVFWRLIVPLSVPGTAVVIIFVFLSSYIEYMCAVTLTRTSTMTFPIYIAGFSTVHKIYYQKMLAAAAIGMIPTALIIAGLQKYIIAGLTAGWGKQ